MAKVCNLHHKAQYRFHTRFKNILDPFTGGLLKCAFIKLGNVCSLIYSPTFFYSTDWLLANGLYDNFEMLSDADLNLLLGKFYPEVRSREGKQLSKSSFHSIRAGINRHLKNPPYNRKIDIANWTVYTSSNQIFLSVLKRLDNNPTPYPPISEMDLKKIQQVGSFDQNHPKGLQEKVFFDVQYHFHPGGAENLRNLKTSAFEIKFDPYGKEYVEFTCNTYKNQASKSPQVKSRMYATYDAICPVASFKKYISKLDPRCDIFYVKPMESHFDPDMCIFWYKTKPHGVNSLSGMMRGISERLQLSMNYTNHSIRAVALVVEEDLKKDTFQFL